eukprot:COSAG06_NODE_6977_length_2689_cov_40.568726_1_plen_682_part_00
MRILGYSYGNWTNDSGEQKKSNMLLLSYCETDLEKMIYGKDEKLPTLHNDYTKELMVKLIREIIAGLCYCHSKGVCHLDFKPENCLLAKDDSGEWTAKIADFGVQVGDESSNDADTTDDQPTSEGDPTAAAEERQANQHGSSSRKDGWLGTYLWMSPEATGLNVERGYEKGRVCARASDQSEGVDGAKDSIFGASDWFSFGIVVWEMWTKQLPHNGLGLATDDEGHLTQQVWARGSDGKEDHDVIRGNEPDGGEWKEDFRTVATSYYNGNRPKIPDDCPTLLSKLMVACWQDKQQDRPSSDFMQKLVDGTTDWLHVDAAAPEVSFDEWLADVGVEARKDELYEYDVREGKAPLEKLVEMMTEEEEDFAEMLDDLFAGNEDTRERFRAAVVELKELAEQSGGDDRSTSTAHQPGALEALQAAAFSDVAEPEPEPEPDLRSTMTLSSKAERLEDMEVGALRTEARAQVGVSPAAIEIAGREEYAKAALIALILNRHTVYRWEHESGTWNTYQLNVQTRLQAAHREGTDRILLRARELRATDGSTECVYDINLRSMMQTNVDSGTQKKLQRTMEHGDSMNHRLHEAINAAKEADWKQLDECIFSTSNGAERLPNALINTVPHPRTYGILHQIAFFGRTDVYMDLTSKGVSFDLTLPDRNGETAKEVADKHNRDDFARMLASMTI